MVQCARLEVGGALTFVMKHPSDDEMFRKEMRERMTRIEELLLGSRRSA
jgi:hypothetical protein